MKNIATFGLTALVSFTVAPAFAGTPIKPPVEPPTPPAQACEDRFDWPDDLAAHVLNGPLDGSFDYDFSGAAIDNIAGQYTDAQQSAWWNVGYADTSYLSDAMVDGAGSVSLDGNMKVTSKTTTTDTLGQVWEETVQRERLGCQEQRVLDPEGLALEHTGEWSAGTYSYEEQRPLARSRELSSLIANVVGTLHADGSSEATATYQHFGQEANTTIIVSEQRNLDGERSIQMQLSSLDAARSSTTTITPDGTATKTGYYGYDPRWDYGTTLDYAGFGTGWLYSGDYEVYCYLQLGVVCTRSCWDIEAIEELQEELEDEGVEWELEFGEYIDALPADVDNFCNSVLFEDYAITPY